MILKLKVNPIFNYLNANQIVIKLANCRNFASINCIK